MRLGGGGGNIEKGKEVVAVSQRGSAGEGAALTELVIKQRLTESGERPVKYFQGKHIFP